VRDWPTKAEARKANEHLLSLYNKTVREASTVQTLVERYRAEGMPERKSTRRGYETWLKNYILPRWGALKLTEVKPDPVEMWFREQIVPLGRNPMDLVTIRKQKGEKKRLLLKDLTVEQFQALLKILESNLELQTMVIVTLSSGLRISETRGLQWKDVDWLGKTVTLVRGVVKQDVDDVKTEDSARTMPLADGVIGVLTRWKQVSEFTRPDDWIFASPWKLGRQPVCYSWIWENLSIAGKAAGIGHLSSHAFRNAYRTWLDAIGTPVGVQQKMMRHADIRTTMNHYGTALKADMRKASDAVGRVSAGFKAS